MKKINKTILVISIIFSLLFFTGYSIDHSNTIDLLFKYSLKYTFLSIIFIIISYSIILFLYKNAHKLNANNNFINKLYYYLFEKYKNINIPLLLLFIIGLPMIILFYPGMVQWDGFEKLNYYFGKMEWTTHHPVLPTIIMGICVKIGNLLINDNFGVFIFNIVEFVISRFVFTYAIFYLVKIKAPKKITIFSLLFYLLNPVLLFNSYTIIKDTYYFLFMIIFFIQYLKCYSNNENKLFLIFSSLMVIMFRKNGIFIIIPSLLLLFFYKNINRKQIFKYLLTIIIINLLFSTIIHLSGIKPGSINEAISIPIQQTSRYIKYNKLTKDEINAYNKLTNNKIEIIKKIYIPEISDTAKSKFVIKNNKDLKLFIKYWFKGLIKNPKVYLNAFFENTYGYFYPPKKQFAFELITFNIEDSYYVNYGNLNISMSKKFDNNRNLIINFINYVKNIFGIKLLFNTGIYLWIYILSCGYLIYNKKYDLILLSIPILLSLTFCFLSPVNGLYRYALPYIVMLPIYLGYILKEN